MILVDMYDHIILNQFPGILVDYVVVNDKLDILGVFEFTKADEIETDVFFCVFDGEMEIIAIIGMVAVTSRYEAVVTEDEEGYKTYSAPAVSVVFTTTGYPDYSSTSSCVTRIVVTDPEITFYGLTMNSKTDDIKKTMKSYKFRQNSDCSYSKNNCTIRFEEDQIYLGAVVTNVNCIVF